MILRQKLSGVLVDFVEFARNVVIKIEKSSVDVLRSVHRRLVLTGPRFNVNDWNASVERAEILEFLKSKWHLWLDNKLIKTYQICDVGDLNGVLNDFDPPTTIAFLKLISIWLINYWKK